MAQNPNTELPKEPKVKKYVAIITQNGTNPPTVQIIQNTFTGLLSWFYNDVGQYQIATTATNDKFTENKIFITISPNNNTTNYIAWTFIEESTIELGTFIAGSRANNVLINTPIKIEVYNL